MLDDRQVPLIEHGSSRKSARNQLMVSRKINVKFSHFRIMTNNVAISVPNKLTTHIKGVEVPNHLVEKKRHSVHCSKVGDSIQLKS